MYLCTAAGAGISAPEDARLCGAELSEPRPAGLAGTHIHYLEPVTDKRSVWHIGYQEVLAIGRLFATDCLPTERIIAIEGPMAVAPRLVRSCSDGRQSKIPEGRDRRSQRRSGGRFSGYRRVSMEKRALGVGGECCFELSQPVRAALSIKHVAVV